MSVRAQCDQCAEPRPRAVKVVEEKKSRDISVTHFCGNNPTTAEKSPHPHAPEMSSPRTVLDGVRGRSVCVTGGAGFIGSHLCALLLRLGARRVVAVDSMVPFYDPAVKEARVRRLDASSDAFFFVRADVADRVALDAALAEHSPEVVCHLAAQPGVRWCEAHPEEADRSNVEAMASAVAAAEAAPSVRHLVFASSSSVYGRQPGPWGEELPARPTGRYASSKAAGEELCRAAARHGRVAVTVLRLFSVYGPDGRPDMAPLAFTRMVHAGEPVTIFGDGRHARDFTHVSDVADAFARCVGASPVPGARTFNVGGGSPATVLELLAEIEARLGVDGRCERLHTKARPEDVPTTHSRTGALREALGWRPRVGLAEGVAGLVKWYLADVAAAAAAAAAAAPAVPA